MTTKPTTFQLHIDEIQPTQLYISEEKLNKVMSWIDKGSDCKYDPIPVKELNGKIIYVDGHTRATALHMLGQEIITVMWEPEEWDWEAYQICVDWCLSEEIKSIQPLVDRVIGKQAYETLWHDRCRAMHKRLEEKRK